MIPQIRNPIHVAQQWATLWEISEGRAILGAGTGAGKDTIYRRQFDAAAAVRGKNKDALGGGMFFKRRTALFGECLDVINRLWTEDKLRFEGQFYKFGEMTLGVARPKKKPPILVSGGIYIPAEGVGAHHYTWNKEVAGTFMMGPKIRRIIAEQGDGWLFVHATLDEMDEIWKEIQGMARDTGRGPNSAYGGPVTRAANWFANCDNDPRKARESVQNQLTDFHGPPEGRGKTQEDLVDRWTLAGPGKDMADKINAYIDRGVTLFQLVIASADQMGMMRKIADEVLPHVKRQPPSSAAA